MTIAATKNMTLAERLAFYSRSDASGCRVWTGYKIGDYGSLKWEGRMRRAHRLAWTVAFGAPPPGMCVCHRCDVPECINPDHLFLGTIGENNADARRKGRMRYVPLFGPSNGKSKLSWEQVLVVRSDSRPSVEIAAALGVSPKTINAIRAGRARQREAA